MDELWVTGVGQIVVGEEGAVVDPLPFLKARKNRKFMGRQDELAVIAAGQALASAGLGGGERVGLFLAVGYIPFEASDIEPVLQGSLDPGGRFSLRRFGEEGLHRAHPLLTFRCLPNMPAFHVSMNFDLQGPSAVLYPGPGAMYLALEEARAALRQGRADAALLLGVAHQRNFLVEHHFARLQRPLPPGQLRDAAGCLILETPERARGRGARPMFSLQKATFSPTPGEPDEQLQGPPLPSGAMGPASLPVGVALAARHGAGSITHRVVSLAGAHESAWRPASGEGAAPRASARHRVVVTGMGVVSPLGSSVEALRQGLLAGASGVGPITVFDASALATRIAAEVKESIPALAERCGVQERWVLRDRKVIFALDAARQAMAQAGQPQGAEGGAVSVGVGLELFSMDDLVALRAPGYRPASTEAERLAFLQTPSDRCAPLMAERFGLQGPPMVHVSACAAGTDAIGAAFRQVASGRRRWALVGGTDSMINPLGVAGFCTLNATSTRNDEPRRASRPFDRRRDGFVLGEGAAMLVIETLEDALARGAVPLAEIIGYGNSLDAHGISEPHPEGRGALLAMRRALEEAQVTPDQIDAVYAHGTGTPKNDPVETLALRRLLGHRAPEVPVTAAKSMIGHCISAAGAIEVVAAIACMRERMIHPTINLEDPDPACDLDYVPGAARALRQRIVLKNSFAFGGQNACLLLQEAP
ncbi:MAG: beta-ketoacyl-ACP synthase II [Polyangiaceae bacterium]|jgi:3-oxoacyl-[acyl-carrier-protein] synthase II|nr:beta-ketoacyl-ACP synthase II [Polyangiaceae bacterium]